MSAGGTIGMVLDRALNPNLLDVALRVATEYGDAEDARQLLTVALRDFVTPQEAANKTRKILTHVWVVPPAPARLMIRWAIDHQGDFSDRRALHYGAILATFPFVGSMASTVGRQLHLEGRVDPQAVKSFARATFGEREFIDAGAMKTLATLRRLGLLVGPKRGPYGVGAKLTVPSSFSGWFLHALLLTRQVDSVGVDDLRRAFELATMEVSPLTAGYPLLETHEEGRGSVAVARDVVCAGPKAHSVAQPSRQAELEFGAWTPLASGVCYGVDRAPRSDLCAGGSLLD